MGDKNGRVAGHACTDGIEDASQAMGPLHGYGIARRIEQTSGDLLSLNYGTLYPALLKLEQEGAIASEVGNFGKQSQGEVLPPDARRAQAVEQEARQWKQATGDSWLDFFRPGEEQA